MYRNTPTTHVLTEKLVVKILQPISSWRMEMDRLKAHVEQRVPPRSLDISDAVVGYAQQLEFARFVEPQIGSNPHYFKSVLSRYIEQIESCSEETSDEVYELLVDPVVLNSRELAPDVAEVVKYHVGGFSRADDCVMKVEETPRLISGVNTTGLRTWEAALFLANFINNRDDDGEMRALFKDKVVLELGCGTGLLGLSLAKYGLVRRMIMTDGSTAVFEHNRKLVELNGLDTSAAVSWQQLVWGDDAFCIKEKVDVVVGADITYDSRILEPLCKTIDGFFKSNGLEMAIIAATVRNIETIERWEQELHKHFNGMWQVSHRNPSPGLIESMCYFDKCTPEIRIYRIIQSRFPPAKLVSKLKPELQIHGIS